MNLLHASPLIHVFEYILQYYVLIFPLEVLHMLKIFSKKAYSFLCYWISSICHYYIFVCYYWSSNAVDFFNIDLLSSNFAELLF